jgi:hypothetical protein
MNRGSKFWVGFAAAALTFGSLMFFVGPHHYGKYGYGMQHGHGCYGYGHHHRAWNDRECGQGWNEKYEKEHGDKPGTPENKTPAE